MSILVFSLILFLGAILAGLVGSLTGLGGGVIIIPLLTLGLGVDLHYAIGASIISVIATSSGSAAAYVREGITNIRLGMFLEIATTIGAVIGVMVAVYLNANYIAILFGCILVFSALMALVKKVDHRIAESPNKWALWLKLNSTFPEDGKIVPYGVKNVPAGFLMMLFAGAMSGILGIGSGALKVIAMDNIMRLPFKVSTTTSNFMMGVTAVASALVYAYRGQIVIGIAMPVCLGVLIGATFGAKILLYSKPTKLKQFFAVVIILLALQMIYKGIVGSM
ncbi:MAG: sulfite exporter TauE/SafE family protein [Pedobacter sp.]|nr:MAG: sulfite exporter TauE/SafE family protein [Pedobacter sp.]